VLILIFSGIVSYGSDRIQYWLDPWADPSGKGYQTIQSLLAIGSGGLLGRGIGQSRQKYLWVPEPHNDFIFSIVCEELGLMGATLIVLLFALTILRGYWIALHSPDRFSTVLASGLITLIAVQTILNLCVVTNLLPSTGIALPFFSYGGTALAVNLGEMGILLGISRNRRNRQEEWL
jgi:cell division protein FtsW